MAAERHAISHRACTDCCYTIYLFEAASTGSRRRLVIDLKMKTRTFSVPPSRRGTRINLLHWTLKYVTDFGARSSPRRSIFPPDARNFSHDSPASPERLEAFEIDHQRRPVFEGAPLSYPPSNDFNFFAKFNTKATILLEDIALCRCFDYVQGGTLRTLCEWNRYLKATT